MRHDRLAAIPGFSGRDIVDGPEEPPAIEQAYPFEGSELRRLERAPQPLPVNEPIKAADGLGQSIVIAVSKAADRGRDPTSASRPVILIATY